MAEALPRGPGGSPAFLTQVSPRRGVGDDDDDDEMEGEPAGPLAAAPQEPRTPAPPDDAVQALAQVVATARAAQRSAQKARLQAQESFSVALLGWVSALPRRAAEGLDIREQEEMHTWRRRVVDAAQAESVARRWCGLRRLRLMLQATLVRL